MNTSRFLLRGAACAVLAASALPATTFAAQQWQKQSPIPADWHIQAEIDFLDPLRGYMVGFQDTPLETVDGGLTWNAAQVPGDDYEVVFALDAQHAWLVGAGGTIRTTDGGQSWQTLPTLGTARYVEFLTPSFGWVDTNGATAVTHDGGLSWTYANPSFGIWLDSADFIDEQVGLSVQEDGSRIWRTADGGATWQPVYTGTTAEVAFLSSSTALAVGFDWPDYVVHRSTDGGATWQTLPTNVGGAQIMTLGAQHAFVHNGMDWSLTTDGGLTWTHGSWSTGVHVTRVVPRDAGELFACDIHGNVLMSSDSGATWTQTRQGPYVALSDMEFLSDGRAVAVGTAYALTSENNGATWDEVSSGTHRHIYDLAMWDDQRGLFCGAAAATCTTGDGGAQWNNRRPAWEFSGMNDAEAISTVGSDFAIVVGEAGAPIVTHDGGQTWAQLDSFTASHGLQSVDFVTEQLGWVGSVGPTAWLLRTTDGGQSWEIQYGPTFGDLRAIDMLDANLGYAIGGGPLLLKTTDGGQNWIQSSPPTQGAVDLQFADAQTGWLVGTTGTILRTTDGAASWQAQDAGTTELLVDVEVVDANEVWVVGYKNTVLHTTDGGQTWQSVSVPTGDPFHNWETVEVAPGGGIYLGGWNGLVMHLSGDGSSGWFTYCTAKTTSLGCTPSISATGTPGPDAGAPFVVSVDQVPSRQSGIFFYGTNGPASVPFQGGTLCVAGPMVRTPVQNSGGSFPPASDCSGVLSIDLDAWIADGHDPSLTPGTTVNGQFWFRDPGDAFGTGLSDGIELVLQP